MKKLVSLFSLLLLSCCFLFSQSNSSDEVNRNTAIRCLKLSESYYMSYDWENAYEQAELGLSYDGDISDLIYLRSAAEVNMNRPKADIIKSMELAFEKNNWVDYTQKGARILYADLLSDTRRYKESLKVLDSDPFLFSADAEFIRIKNLYRMGTKESIEDARDKVGIAGRIYSKDSRFPNIFFMFELMYLTDAERKGERYEVPKSVKNIAKNYIKRLPDYDGNNLNTEIMSVFFAKDEEERDRLLKAIDAKNDSNNFLLAYAGLKTGLYTEQQAFDLFFAAADNYICLYTLEDFALSITEEGVKQRFVEKLLNYNGIITIDENYDLQPEIIIEYEVGRPHNIKYDYNNDGIIDLDIDCDFGEPVLINFGIDKVNAAYMDYPYVDEIFYDERTFAFKFFDSDYEIKPVELVPNDVFSNMGIDFFVPVISENISIPSFEQLKLDSTAVRLPTKERNNSSVIYTVFEGHPVFADFYEDDVRYAFADFSTGFPITRHVDQDNDGVFETNEIFNITEKTEDYITTDEAAYVESIFSSMIFDDKNVYLSKIEIDRNRNTYFEFTEEYLGLNGKITTWDNDDNGVPDSQYIKYPKEEEKELKEDSLFFDSDGEVYISIKFIGGVPIKMDYKDSEVIVFAGNNKNFYWIDEECSDENEQYILDNVLSDWSNGIMKIVQVDDLRFSVVKVNDKIFCKLIPVYEYDENNK